MHYVSVSEHINARSIWITNLVLMQKKCSAFSFCGMETLGKREFLEELPPFKLPPKLYRPLQLGDNFLFARYLLLFIYQMYVIYISFIKLIEYQYSYNFIMFPISGSGVPPDKK